ncbi:MAG: AMP-binding protein [Acidobacteriota bacterium]
MTRRESPATSVVSAHRDSFCRDRLPPEPLLPVLEFSGLPELAYPERLNCAVELIDTHLPAAADRVAFYFPGGSWTYAELAETVDRIARVLVEDLSLIPGNRVLLRGPNSPWLAACWFAVLKAGGVVVCTMPLLRARELQYIAEKAQIRLALTDARFAADCELAMPESSGKRVVRFGTTGEAGSLEDLLRGKPSGYAACDTAAEDVALIAFTSGTTGEAKGTMHTHRDLLACCDCFPPQVLKATADDRFIGSPPLAFTYGLGGILLFPLRIGASTVLLEQASPLLLLKGIHEFRATVCFTAPTAYRAMLPLIAEDPTLDVSCLRRCVSAGETLPLPTFEAWRAATGLSIIDGLGSTEMLHIFISSSGDDIRPGATGKVVPGYRARVIDANAEEVPRGTLGRLAVRGPTGCRYLDDSDRQRAYVQDGWNLTGDAYIEDEDGYFWYQARTDDMIVSSGYNISGPEVESVLLDHPAVHECGVVAAPDAERGHVVKAFVVLSSGAAPGEALVKELQDFVKREIAPYKYPRRIEFVQSLPRTATGKLQRFELRLREAPR